ncbi:hypothetical protein [Methylocaldum szegediense]|jgi:nitrate reductase cytochrome c-type subunit|uniref:Lipoprotein n=1 Tax=Methylocaldum szegediense TaxID=73780 RepID=A0ABN8X248_9GAMM|nr:hypothetical protein [Methylocaldum szegediense]CAI8826096.1 conserved protein of unknown function [Methylocaldum szegediense]
MDANRINKPRRFFGLLAFVMLGGLWSSCATVEADRARNTEQLLAAAGFKVRPADNPEQLAHVQTLTQHKLVPHEKDGTVYYVYADASTCRCIYWGPEEAYQRYQRLAAEREIAEDQRMAAEMNEDAAMNWELWGPRYWWIY